VSAHGGLLLRRDIAQRDDTDETLVSIDDGQPADLFAAHVVRDVIDRLIRS
jgi:hypothetical protein